MHFDSEINTNTEQLRSKFHLNIIIIYLYSSRSNQTAAKVITSTALKMKI